MKKDLKDRLHFNNISKSYVKKDLYDSSRYARKLRLYQTLNKVDLGASLNVLEIGCGAGFSAEYLKGYYNSYIGIDHSENLIDFAISYHKYNNVSFYASDYHNFYTDKKFDIIFMIGVLHHMADRDKVIIKSYNLLRNGGHLVINEPHPSNPIISLIRNVRKKVDKSYSDDQDELSGVDLVDLFQNNGFKDLRTYSQGIFSTPVAEVVINPQVISKPLSKIFCRIDGYLEMNFNNFLKRFSWNIIVSGMKTK